MKAAFLVLIACFVIHNQAKTVFVSPTGTGSGTTAQTAASLDSGVGFLSTGDELRLLQGDYAQPSSGVYHQIDASNVTIRGESRDLVNLLVDPGLNYFFLFNNASIILESVTVKDVRTLIPNQPAPFGINANFINFKDVHFNRLTLPIFNIESVNSISIGFTDCIINKPTSTLIANNIKTATVTLRRTTVIALVADLFATTSFSYIFDSVSLTLARSLLLGAQSFTATGNNVVCGVATVINFPLGFNPRFAIRDRCGFCENAIIVEMANCSGACVPIGTPPTCGKRLFVNPQGSGGSGLTMSTAFTSLTTALSTATYGDTILLARGGPYILTNNLSLNAKKVTIGTYSVTGNLGGHVDPAVIQCQGGGVGLRANGSFSDTVLQDIAFKNCDVSISIAAGSLTLSNVEILQKNGTTSHSITLLPGGALVFENLIFRDTDSNFPAGIDVPRQTVVKGKKMRVMNTRADILAFSVSQGFVDMEDLVVAGTGTGTAVAELNLGTLRLAGASFSNAGGSSLASFLCTSSTMNVTNGFFCQGIINNVACVGGVLSNSTNGPFCGVCSNYTPSTAIRDCSNSCFGKRATGANSSCCYTQDSDTLGNCCGGNADYNAQCCAALNSCGSCSVGCTACPTTIAIQ